MTSLFWISAAILIGATGTLTTWITLRASRSDRSGTAETRTAVVAAPCPPARPSTPQPQHAPIGRLPILDNRQRIVAYTLILPARPTTNHSPSATDIATTARELLDALQAIGAESLRNRRIFFTASRALLNSGYLDLIAPTRVVLELTEIRAADDELLAKCRALREQGFELAVDATVLHANLGPLLNLADYARVEVTGVTAATLADRVEQLRRYPVRLIASGVNSSEGYAACQDHSMDYYQGLYLVSRIPMSAAKSLSPSMRQVTQVVNLLVRRAEPRELEAAVKQDLALSYKLLRHINSASLGLVSEVKSIGHALRILGHEKLLRWTALYLLSLRHAKQAAPSAHEAVYALALQRARTMELLAVGRCDDGRRDALFLVGMFSLIDALLGVTLAHALAEIRLPDGVSAALLHGQGPYAPYLDLAKAAEVMDHDQVLVLARDLGLSIAEVNRAQLEATHWMEDLTHRAEPAHSTAA